MTEGRNRTSIDITQSHLFFPPIQPTLTSVSSRVTSLMKKASQHEENCPLSSCLISLENYCEDELFILL